MKITIDVDCTPEEARRFMGLPDITPLNEVVVAQMKERAEKGLSPQDIEALMQQWTAGAATGFTGMQKAVLAALDKAGK